MTSMAVAIVSYNTQACLQDCLKSTMAQRPREVVVVDNASADGSAEMVAREFPDVRLVVNAANVGFGAAANQALAQCTAPHVLLLNSDTQLLPGTLVALRDYLVDHPGAALVGPRLVTSDRRLQPSCFPYPTPFNALLEISRVGECLHTVPVLRERYLRTSRHCRSRVVPWVLGAALAIRRSAFEAVGGFDETFFMYGEEIDLCYRLAARGWQTHFAPVATVVHVGGASAAGCRAEMAVRSLLARVAFYQRHYSKRWQTELRLILGAAMLTKMARDGLRLPFAGPRSSRRRRLTENIGVWRHVLRDLTTDMASQS